MGEFVHVYNDGGGIRDVPILQGAGAVLGGKDRNSVPNAGSSTIMSVGIPFVIPPGDGGSTGLLFTGTLGTFSLAGSPPAWASLKGCYIWMPAGFGGSAYPAGWYWGVFSGDTAGILYMDTYVSGIPKRPISPTPFPVNLSGRITTPTSEITGPTGFTLKGGSLGPNGKLKFHAKVTGNITSNKAYSVFLGSNRLFLISPITTSPTVEFLVSSSNQGSESMQASSRPSGTTGVGTAGATYTGPSEQTSIDTSLDYNVSISLQVPLLNTACAVLLYADLSVTYGD
jgi:hypothetical protein